MEWKALANRIIHDGEIPGFHRIGLRCEKCGCDVFEMLYHNSFPGRVPESRMSLYILRCPACGSQEMDGFGTYPLPDLLPGTILPFVGHFLSFVIGLGEKVGMLCGKRE